MPNIDDFAARYVHGYAPAEQRRLIAQAEFWRDRLILDGPALPDGTRLLEIGCGVGAGLGILGGAFPGVHLTGVDVEPRQIAAAHAHLTARGLGADLRVADGRQLPFADGSFDHVWMMWVLEHLTEDGAMAVLREARRVLVPGGTITAIEADYATVRFGPPSPALEWLRSALLQAMRAFGQDDAGTQLWGWLDGAGFGGIEPGERLFSYRGAETGPVTRYLADTIAATFSDVALLPGRPDEEMLRCGLEDLQALDRHPGAWVRFVIHKAQARA
jgi:ubiquinone/menaquinone biosynthesis C-methylase UbiE